jgi:hypothetical protein
MERGPGEWRRINELYVIKYEKSTKRVASCHNKTLKMLGGKKLLPLY